MLTFRARGFALRDAFGDVLRGLRTTEEAQDMEPVNVTPPEAAPTPKRRKVEIKEAVIEPAAQEVTS
jgi:hypothetical protein